MTKLAEEMPAPIAAVACQCYGPGRLQFPDGSEQHHCVCSQTERAMRAGGPLTPDQRAWCLEQIAMVEGWDRARHEGEDDAQLQRTVIAAWTDYCRDNGLL